MNMLKPNYLLNSDNKKVAVQLNIETFRKIEEVLENYGLYKLMQDGNDVQKMTLVEGLTYYKTLKRKK